MEIVLKAPQVIRISAGAENYCGDVFKLTMAIHTMTSLFLRFSVLCMLSSLCFWTNQLVLPVSGASTEPVLGIITKREAKDMVLTSSWGNNTHTSFYLKTKWSETK